LGSNSGKDPPSQSLYRTGWVRSASSPGQDPIINSGPVRWAIASEHQIGTGGLSLGACSARSTTGSTFCLVLPSPTFTTDLS